MGCGGSKITTTTLLQQYKTLSFTDCGMQLAMPPVKIPSRSGPKTAIEIAEVIEIGEKIEEGKPGYEQQQYTIQKMLADDMRESIEDDDDVITMSEGKMWFDLKNRHEGTQKFTLWFQGSECEKPQCLERDLDRYTVTQKVDKTNNMFIINLEHQTVEYGSIIEKLSSYGFIFALNEQKNERKAMMDILKKCKSKNTRNQYINTLKAAGPKPESRPKREHSREEQIGECGAFEGFELPNEPETPATTAGNAHDFETPAQKGSFQDLTHELKRQGSTAQPRKQTQRMSRMGENSNIQEVPDCGPGFSNVVETPLFLDEYKTDDDEPVQPKNRPSMKMFPSDTGNRRIVVSPLCPNADDDNDDSLPKAETDGELSSVSDDTLSDDGHPLRRLAETSGGKAQPIVMATIVMTTLLYCLTVYRNKQQPILPLYN